jgi:hypothetical protein
MRRPQGAWDGFVIGFEVASKWLRTGFVHGSNGFGFLRLPFRIIIATALNPQFLLFWRVCVDRRVLARPMGGVANRQRNPRACWRKIHTLIAHLCASVLLRAGLNFATAPKRNIQFRKIYWPEPVGGDDLTTKKQNKRPAGVGTRLDGSTVEGEIRHGQASTGAGFRVTSAGDSERYGEMRVG